MEAMRNKGRAVRLLRVWRAAYIGQTFVPRVSGPLLRVYMVLFGSTSPTWLSILLDKSGPVGRRKYPLSYHIHFWRATAPHVPKAELVV